MVLTEWAYSKDKTVPAELVSTDPAAIDALVQRDTGSSPRHANTYRTASTDALNALNVYPVVRVGDPATRWQTVKTEMPSYIATAPGESYEIVQSWSDGPIEDCRAMARTDAANWLEAWQSSEFTHLGTVYDINADQERRLSVKSGQTSGTFTASWYAKDGSKMEFPNRTTWDAFYDSAIAHIETGNDAFEAAISQIDSAANTAALDTILAGLPPIPGALSVRATGPLRAPQEDPGATEPRISSRS